jgi:hypothetical protein
MKGRKELRGRVSAMVNIAVTVSLTLASNPGDAADRRAGRDAIGGTGRDAIGGTGLYAIGGTGRDAMAGTGKKERVLVRGPVQGVNLSANSVTIFGRDFRLAPDRARLIHDGLAGGQSVVLTISGELGRTGKLVLRKASIDHEQYVAGSSQVVIAGRVRAVDSLIGRVVIGKQAVDLTTAPTAAGSPSVKAGDVIVVVGTQPSLSGTISAQLVMHSD